MSESSVKGKSLELTIAKTLRKKLGIKVERDKRSGAGTNKSDISDWNRELPLHIEAKNHKTIKIKEFFAQAEQASSVGQAPTVVFTADREILACLRFDDLVNFIAEIQDYKAIIEDLRATPTFEIGNEHEISTAMTKDSKVTGAVRVCREGHLADEYGYCQILTCKFSRGYRPPKGKR